MRPARAYLLAMLISAVAIGTQLLIEPWVGTVAFLLLYPAVFLSAWFCGSGPGAMATLLLASSAAYFFMGPDSSLFGISFDDHFRLAVFTFFGFLLSWIIGRGRKAEASVQRSETRFRLLVEGTRDHGIIFLDPEGRITDWNPGAERIQGYRAEEILGQHFSVFYPPEVVKAGHTERELEIACAEGSYHEEGWRLRKDGSRYWAEVTLTCLKDRKGVPMGYSKMIRDLTERKRAEDALRKANDELERRVEDRTVALVAANRELEAFCYSVSHDLRSPLRGIDGFSEVLAMKYAERLDEQGRKYLERIRAATQRMGQLIDDLLKLSRLSRVEMKKEALDLSKVVERIVQELRVGEPERQVEVVVQPGLVARGDRTLLGSVLENLLGNAWKFTSQTPRARIEFGERRMNGVPVYFVRDNGAGFSMDFADQLFGAFQRLHKATEFPGTGIGLASVRRIIHRHNGEVWAEAEPDKGAAFYFTIDYPKRPSGGVAAA